MPRLDFGKRILSLTVVFAMFLPATVFAQDSERDKLKKSLDAARLWLADAKRRMSAGDERAMGFVEVALQKIDAAKGEIDRVDAESAAAKAAADRAAAERAAAEKAAADKAAAEAASKAVISGFTLAATEIIGGATTTGTITLAQPAPGLGVEVRVSSGSDLVVVPPIVAVRGGQSAATFTIQTRSPRSATPVVIEAATTATAPPKQVTLMLTMKPSRD